MPNTRAPAREMTKKLNVNLNKLFSELSRAGYGWTAKTPDQLLSLRKNPGQHRALDRFFGIGLRVSSSELISDGLSMETTLAFGDLTPFAVSTDLGGGCLIHDHWPPRPENAGEYVHLGPESFYLAREMEKNTEVFDGKKVLDLGCGSGVL